MHYFLNLINKSGRPSLRACFQCCAASRSPTTSTSFHFSSKTKIFTRKFSTNINRNSSFIGRTIFADRYRDSNLLVNTSFIRFASSKSAENVVSSSENTNSQDLIDDASLLAEIPDPPLALPDSQLAILDFESKCTLAYWGLDTSTPAGLVRMGLEWTHNYTGLPWWEVIAICTLSLRLLTSYSMVLNQRHAAKMRVHTPKMQEMHKQMMDAKRSGDEFQTQLVMFQLQSYYKDNKINPLKPLLLMAPNMLIFVSCFLGLKKMADAPIESMKTEGFMWFTDLTLPDPYWFILPGICAATLSVVMHLGIDTGQSTDTMNKYMKYFMRYGMPSIVLITTSYFSSALLVYWCASNFTALIMASIFRTEYFRRLFKIPIAEPVKAQKKKSTFKLGNLLTKRFYTEKFHQINEKRYVPASEADLIAADNEAFTKAGKAPPKVTFPYNPVGGVLKAPPAKTRLQKIIDFVTFKKYRKSVD